MASMARTSNTATITNAAMLTHWYDHNNQCVTISNEATMNDMATTTNEATMNDMAARIWPHIVKHYSDISFIVTCCSDTLIIVTNISVIVACYSDISVIVTCYSDTLVIVTIL